MIDPNAAGNVTIVLDADEADELAQFLGYHTRVRDGVIPVRGHTVACELLFRVSKSIGKNFNDYTKDPDDDDGSGLGPGDDPTPDPF